MYDVFNAAFKVSGARSFRLSSTQLLKTTQEKGLGGNAQNIADEARQCFVPRDGYVFIQADLESAEAVAIALLVREGNFRELIRYKIKPHNFVCLHLFPDKFVELLTQEFIAAMKPADLANHALYKQIVKLCKKLKVEYDLAKRTVHGSNYSMGWRTLRDTVLKGTKGAVVLTAAEAKRLLATYFTLFPEIKEYQQQTEQLVKEHKPVYNLFGHRAQFIGRFTGSLARTVISWPPQSTVGQCTNIAMNRLQGEIEQNNHKWNILAPVHDSILVECPIPEQDECAAALKRVMSFTLKSPVDGWECAIGVEVQRGRNWRKYDEKENPDGMKVVEI